MSDIYTFTIEVFTDALTIVGSYDLPLYRRVSDALNSRLHRFITLRDATVAPIWKPQQGQRVAQIMVDVGSALLVSTLEEPPPPPNVQVPTLPRDTQPMMFFTSAFAMRADFYKRSDMELVSMLGEMTDDFIPLSNVMIFPLQGGAPLNRSFVCLSRLHMQALYAFGTTMAHAPVPASNLERQPATSAPPPPPPLDEPPAAPGDTPPSDDDQAVSEQNVTDRSAERSST